MRLKLLVVSAAAMLLVMVGCAPGRMTTHAVPAQHAPPSIILPATSAPTDPEPSETSATPSELQPGAAAASTAADQGVAQEKTTPSAPTDSASAGSPKVEQSKSPAATSAPVQSPRPAASSTPTTAAVGSRWEDVHLDSLAYSEADQLIAVSASFRDYAAAAMTAADTDGCTVLGLSVMSKHPDGYVVGTLSTDCGGGQAIWVEDRPASTWRVAKVLQAVPLCVELEMIGLPGGVGLLCDDGAGGLSPY